MADAESTAVSTEQLRQWHRNNEYARVVDAVDGLGEHASDECRLLKGLSLSMTGDTAAGMGILQALADTAPTNPDWQSDLALAALLRGDIDRAARELTLLTGSRDATAVDFSRLAAARLAQHRLEDAAALYREAIEREPGRSHWYHNLAGVLVRQQQLDEALETYDAAIRVDPEFSNAIEARRDLLLALERGAELVEELEETLASEPDNHRLRCQLGLALLRQQRFTDALRCVTEGLKPPAELQELRSADSEAYAECLPGQTALRLALADLWNRRGQFRRSLQVLRQANALQQALRPEIRCQEVHALIELRQFDEAADILREVITEFPNSHRAQVLSAQLLCERGDYDEAETQLRELLVTWPGNVGILSCLGQTLLWTGQLDEAAACFEQASRINPMALAQLVRTRRLPETAEAIARMAEVANNALLPPDARAGMAFALAETCDRRGDREEASRYLELANALTRPQLQYRPDRHTRWIQRTMAVYSRAFFDGLEHIRGSARTPVFVVGMPRSGTTLVEQILSAHPDIFGAGELDLLPALGRLMPAVLHSPHPYPECVQELTPVLREEAARYYLHGLDQHDRDHPLVVDKLPHNFINLGLIATVLPDARIIHLRRDPRDIALSNYQQNFKARHGGMGFAFDLAHIAGQLNDHHRIMAHWRQVLPVPLLELRYEDVVADQAGASRALLAFLELEWDESVLSFEQLDRPVRTASVSQVREPIYRSSAGKWRHYETLLRPLIEALDPEVLEGWD